MCRKRLSSPRCRSELIDSAWVVIVPGQKCIKKKKKKKKKAQWDLLTEKGIYCYDYMNSMERFD